MLRRKLPLSIMVLALHTGVALLLLRALPLLELRDQPLYLLVIPTLLASIYFERPVFLGMVAVNAIVAAMAVVAINRDATSPLRVVAWATGASAATCEVLHLLTSLRLRAEDRLRETAQQLRLSEARYRTLVERTPAVSYTLTPNGDYHTEYVSPQIEALLGVKPEEWLATPGAWRAALHPDDAEHVLEELAASRREGRPFGCAYRLRTRTGDIVWVQDHAAEVQTPDGTPFCVQGVWIDITAQKEAEAARQESETRYAELFQNATDIVYAHDLRGRYTAWNRAAEEVTGFSREEILGMHVEQLIAPESVDLARQMTQRKLSGDQRRTTYEIELISRRGERVPIEVSSWVVYRNGKPVGIQGFARDIRERKHLEQQLLQSQKMEAIGRLAGGVAHDFNNMLAVINGYSEFLLRTERLSDTARQGLQEVREAGLRAASLTGQLLSFSRKKIVAPRSVDLNEVVTGMRDMMLRLIGEDVALVTHLDAEPCWVRADRGQIEQVLMNLVVNARDAMPTGGRLTIETDHTLELPADVAETEEEPQAPVRLVRLAVTDTGCGMDAQTLAHVWEPFFTTKGSLGTGLGLATVYSVAQQLGGRVEVQSRVGEGSAFRLLVPASPETSPSRAPAATPTSAGGTETILVVEDELAVRSLVRAILGSEGYRLLEASDGHSALRQLEEVGDQIDLLVTDVVMPGGLSGGQLAEKVRQRCPSAGVLYMSGYTDDALVRHGVSSKEEAFIQKPFDVGEFARRVRSLLDQRRA